MAQDCCYFDMTDGCWSLCDYHAKRTCTQCGTLFDTKITQDEGKCDECADPTVECCYCKRSVPKRLADGDVCWDCHTANWQESEAS